MMKFRVHAQAVFILVLMLSCVGSGEIPNCPGEKLRPEIDALVAPILRRNKFLNKGEDKVQVAMVEELNARHDPAAREARVALLPYSMGEQAGQELFCAVLLDGRDTLPLIDKYSRCAPGFSGKSLLFGFGCCLKS